MLKANYDKWRARLAGEKVMTFTEPDENDVGCYRLPTKQRQPNGQWKTLGFKPVLLAVLGDAVVCQIGANVVSEDRRNETWTSFVQHPISEEWLKAAQRGEPWPDFTSPVIYANRTVRSEEDRDAIMESIKERDPEAAVMLEEQRNELPQEEIKRRLDLLKSDLAKFPKIESDVHATVARAMQEKFLEIRGEAAGHYEEANRPLLDQQKALRTIWFPLRDEADDSKTSIGNALGAWEDTKRIAAKRAQEKADREAREHAEATRLAEEANQPPPPPPPIEKPNLPPPAAQIKAPGGRAAKVSLVKIVTEIDVDKAFAQFKNATEVRDVLMALAQRAVTAGLPVDGAVVEDRSKVR